MVRVGCGVLSSTFGFFPLRLLVLGWRVGESHCRCRSVPDVSWLCFLLRGRRSLRRSLFFLFPLVYRGLSLVSCVTSICVVLIL